MVPRRTTFVSPYHQHCLRYSHQHIWAYIFNAVVCIVPTQKVAPPLEVSVVAAYSTIISPHALMTLSGPTRSAWRWTSAVWCLVGAAVTYLVYWCFVDDQTQSGTYGCEMSYMWPTYHAVDWPDSPSSKYALYLYREQGWDRNDQVRKLC
jgi:hypothetical protein